MCLNSPKQVHCLVRTVQTVQNSTVQFRESQYTQYSTNSTNSREQYSTVQRVQESETELTTANRQSFGIPGLPVLRSPAPAGCEGGPVSGGPQAHAHGHSGVGAFIHY